MIKTLLIALLFGFAAGIASAQHHENGLAGNAPAAYSVQETTNDSWIFSEPDRDAQLVIWLYQP